MIYRVQDVEGRGPYRPGMTAAWADPHALDTAPWWVELGEPLYVAHKRFNDPEFHYGCGFDTLEQFRRWFNVKERSALNRLGYRLVTIMPDVILVRTKTQVVFGCRSPLRKASRRISLVSSLAEAA